MYTFVGWHCKFFEGKPALNELTVIIETIKSLILFYKKIISRRKSLRIRGNDFDEFR